MHQLLHIVWNPEIEAFSIFGITIRYYSILFVTGLILAYWVISKLYKDQKIPYEKFDSLYLLPAGYRCRRTVGALPVL